MMAHPRLIALHASDYGGKDTAGKLIEEIVRSQRLGVPETRIPFASRAFATKVKESIAASFGISLEEATEWVDAIKQSAGWVIAQWIDKDGGKHERKIPGRVFVRDFATKGHRELFDPNFWVNVLLPMETGPRESDGWHENFDCAATCVITDLRFNTEAERVWALDGEIWSLIGRGEPFDGDHLSNGDFQWHRADAVLDNSGSIDQLREQIRRLL